MSRCVTAHFCYFCHPLLRQHAYSNWAFTLCGVYTTYCRYIYLFLQCESCCLIQMRYKLPLKVFSELCCSFCSDYWRCFKHCLSQFLWYNHSCFSGDYHGTCMFYQYNNIALNTEELSVRGLTVPGNIYEAVKMVLRSRGWLMLTWHTLATCDEHTHIYLS